MSDICPTRPSQAGLNAPPECRNELQEKSWDIIEDRTSSTAEAALHETRRASHEEAAGRNVSCLFIP